MASAVCFSLAVGTCKNVSGLAISSGTGDKWIFSIVLLAFCFYFNIYECVCTSPEGTGQLVGVGFLLPCGVQELNADLQAWW